MKVFVSWSGELSKKVAQELKRWLPCIIQSIDVFYSSEDIEKGENWDSKISSELSQCNYGIVCLTSENTTAPWVNFEAGAIAKTLDSKVAALMIDIKTSDIQGPLKRYQATKLEKDDIWQLVSDVNKNTETPLDENILRSTFDAIWEKMYVAIKKAIEECAPISKLNKGEHKIENTEAVEEILQLLRKQNVLLNSPEQLFPLPYFQEIQQKIYNNPGGNTYLEELFNIVERMMEIMFNNLQEIEKDDNKRWGVCDSVILELINLVIHMGLDGDNSHLRFRKRAILLREKYLKFRSIIKSHY